MDNLTFRKLLNKMIREEIELQQKTSKAKIWIKYFKRIEQLDNFVYNKEDLNSILTYFLNKVMTNQGSKFETNILKAKILKILSGATDSNIEERYSSDIE